MEGGAFRALSGLSEALLNWCTTTCPYHRVGVSLMISGQWLSWLRMVMMVNVFFLLPRAVCAGDHLLSLLFLIVSQSSVIGLTPWPYISAVCCGRMTSCLSSIMGENIISYSHDIDPAVIFVELCVRCGPLKIYSET